MTTDTDHVRVQDHFAIGPFAVYGRDADISAILNLLTSSAHSIITITGIGGIGKSTVARATQYALADHFPAGIYWITLAESEESTSLLRDIGYTIGSDGSEENLRQRINDLSVRGRTLMIIDGADDPSISPLLTTLLEDWPGLQLLVTGRLPLRIAGERIVPLDPLAIAATGDVLTDLSPAAELFLARVAIANPRVANATQSPDAINQICRALEGIPLAIELAAAWSRLLTVEEIRDHIANRLDHLVDIRIGTDPRQATLHGVIAWSDARLSPTDRTLLRRLSVFRGGFTLEFLRRVIAGREAGQPYPYADGFDIAISHADFVRSTVLQEEPDGPSLRGIGLDPLLRDPVDGLAMLADAGLVRVVSADAGETRYNLFDTVREYCFETMTPAELLAAHHQLAVIQTALWEAGVEGYYYADRAIMPRERLITALPNFRTAMIWLLGQGKPAAELAQRLAGFSWIFWQQNGRVAEGRGWMALAWALDPDAVTAAPWLPALGLLCWIQGDDREAERILDIATQVTAEHGITASEASAWLYKACVAWRKGPTAEADMLMCLRRSRELYLTANEPIGLGLIAQLYGVLALFSGDIDTALERQIEALELHRGCHYVWGEAAANLYIGGLRAQLSMFDSTQFPGAIRHLRDALNLFNEMGDLWGIGASNGALGAILLYVDQVETGARLLGSAREFLRQGHSLLPPFFESVIDEAIESLPETLGPDKAAALLTEGANLPAPERAAFPLMVIDQLLSDADRPPAADPPPVRLTRHQLEIVRLLAEGLKPPQVAQRLDRHPSSVYETIERIQDRLGVNKWDQIVPTAQSQGLLNP